MTLYHSEKETQLAEFFETIKSKSDNLMNYFLGSFFLGGLLLSFFYDTWQVGIGIGGLAVLAYYSARVGLPKSDLYQYILSAVFGIFMAQYIYQMHGLFEMHFIAFIGSAILITYQNWKLQIPLALVVFIHHSVFGFLQFNGFSKVYFTQLEYMDAQTFVIHISLAISIFCICGLWAYHFKKYSEEHIEQSFVIGKLEEEKRQKEIQFDNERKLAELNRELNHVFNNIHDVIFSVDMANYKLTYMSPSCERLYGYKSGDFYSNPNLWSDLIHPGDKKIIDDQFSRLLGGKYVKNKYRIITKDGAIRWIENSVIPTMDEFENLVRLDGISRDITEQKAAEEEVRALNELLEMKVSERTRELETVNKELESFNYTVSHDLRTPLRVISGFTTILSKKQAAYLDTEGKEYMEYIISSVKQMGQLIDDLLNLSRMGRTELAKKETDMNRMVGGVLEQLKKGTENFNAEIKFNSLPVAICDERLMQEVWINLLSNAIKYSRNSQHPYIEIGSTGHNGHTTFYVKDNGAGFNMNCYNKLFNAFQRLHKSSDYEGTGVGLAIVQRIITKHGGKVWAEAKENGGATFFFTLN